MNYSSSKNTIVPVINDTPSKLTDFINKLHSNTHYDTPFLMMPVRLETRFWKEYVNILDELTTDAVATAVTGLSATSGITTSYGTFTGFSSTTAVAAAGEIMSGVSAIPGMLASVSSLGPIEQNQLQYRLDQITGTFSNTAASLLAQCTDADLNAQLSQTIDSINSALQNVQDSIDGINLDTDWQQQVSRDVVQNWSSVTQIVNSNASLVRQIYNNGVIQQGPLDQYLNSSRELLTYFNNYKVDTSIDKQYVWTLLNPLTGQFNAINGDLNRANHESPQTLAQQRLSFNIVVAQLTDAWNQLLFPGLSQNRINPINGIENYKPTSGDVPQEVSDAGKQIITTLKTASETLGQLTAGGGGWNADLYNQYSGQIQAISSLLAGTQLRDTLSQAFVWSSIAPINDQFAQLSAYISSVDPSGAEGLSASYDTLSVGVATSWTTSLTTGGGSVISVFSPWVLVDELWIRVYPDDFEVDSLERGLTADEKAAGIAYWTAWWAAHGNKTLQQQAWQIIVALYGPERAAWIIKLMTPTNLSGVIIVSPFFPVYTHLTLLDSYTTSIAALSSDAIVASADSHLSFYGPQLEYLTATTARIPGITAEYAATAVETVQNASANFAQLGNTILQLTGGQGGESGGGEGGGSFSQTIAGISAQFDTLTSSFTRLPVYATWDELYSETPTFPSPTIVDTSFQQPSVSNVMPDGFLFAAVNNVSDGSYSFRHIKIGNSIPNPLYTSIDPVNSTFSDTSTNHLVVDPSILWMVDFDEAVRIGMGIKIRLTASEAIYGFDKILVLGTRLNGGSLSSLPGVGQQLLQDLLDSHHYTAGGLSLLEVGTPTNNTDTTNSGFNQPDPFDDVSFGIEVSDPLFTGTSTTLNKKDGQWLSDALGIDYSILQHVGNADKSQISNAIATNRILWNGTLGNYMKDMLNFLFTEDNVSRTKNYFTDYVIGRGALPSIRVAEQPYGILPVTSFGRWEWKRLYNQGFPNSLSDGHGGVTSYFLDDYAGPFGANLPSFLQDRYNLRIYSTLELLNNAWFDMALWKVKTNDKNKGISSTQADFMDFLSVDASMSEVYNRYFLNRMKFNTGYTLSNEGNAPCDIWTAGGIYDSPSSFFNTFSNFNSGIFSPGAPAGSAPNPLGDANGLFDINEFFSGGAPDMSKIKNAMRLFSIQLVENYKLYGPTVAEGNALSETAPLPNNYLGKNYIKWLLTSSPTTIWNSNTFSTMPSRSLLFLLLRQGVLLAYREAAWDILESANLFTKVARKIIGSPEGIIAQQANTPNNAIFSKWHLLFENISNVSSSSYLGHSTSLSAPFNFFYNYVGDSTASRPGYTPPTWQGIKLADYLFSPSASLGTGYSDLDTIGSPFLANINDVKASLTQLQTCSTAELDRLMREHIDLCTYRLDAWNYGMVNKKLWTQRNTDGAYSSGGRRQGIYLSCYGWLIDVRPKLIPGTHTSALTAINTSHVPTGLSEFNPVYYDSTNLGFILTPSMAHALAAAVLRSGYISEKNSDDNRFAVNLASERVDLALSLLEGVRNGQTMGALLGYQFERGLHEGYPSLNLDQYIYPLRLKFPISDPATETSTSIAVAENVRPSNVVNGIDLLNFIRSNANVINFMNEYPQVSLYDLYMCPSGGPYMYGGHVLSDYAQFSLFATTTVTSCPAADFNAIMTEIDRMADALDALGDLAISEGIFQVAKGNFSRSAAVMESLTEGKNPSRPEIIDTPRSGIHINNKLAAMVEVTPASSLWTTVSTMTPRASAEPRLNTWIAELLLSPFTGATTLANFPDKIGCEVTFKNISGVTQTMTVLLSNLQLQPIDLLYMVQSDSYKAEVSNRVILYARTYATTYSTGTGIPGSVPVTVILDNKGSAPVASFQQILALLVAISNNVSASKWLKAEDFVYTPNAVIDATKPIYDIPEYLNRATNLCAAASAYISGSGSLGAFPLTLADSTSSNATISSVRTALLNASYYGLSYAVPNSAIDLFTSTPDTNVEALVADLLAQARKAYTDLKQRYDTAHALLLTISAMTDQTKQAKACASVISGILGTGFTSIPLFFFDYYTGLKSGTGGIDDLLTPAITTTSGIMRNHATNYDFDMDNWIYGLARVHTKIDNVESVRLFANSTTHPLYDIRPVQFPYVPASTVPLVTEDYWYGLPYPSTYTPSSDKLSVAIFNHGQLAVATTSTSAGYTSYNVYCGLLLHEWNELIPFNEETTGISFNYDQPRAKPPQNLLLAINPQVLQDSDVSSGVVKTWQMEDLLHTMLDTMDMAKIRMVEPDHFTRAHFDTTTNIGDIKNNENANAIDNGLASIQYCDNGADSNNTAYFEAFKWVLPAVVGEVVPGVVDSHGHVTYDSSGSIQQVSFDFDPNDSPPPILPGTITASGTVTEVANWAAVSSDAILSTSGVTTLITEDSHFTDLATLELGMVAISGVGL